MKLFCPSILDGSSIAYLGISCLIEKKCTLVISSLPRIDKVLYLNICTLMYILRLIHDLALSIRSKNTAFAEISAPNKPS